MKLKLRLIPVILGVVILPILLLTGVYGFAAGNDDLTLAPKLQQAPRAVVAPGQQPGALTGNNTAGMTGAPELHDIYPPVELPSPPPLWLWGAIAAAVVVLTLLGIFLVRRRRRRATVAPTSAEDQALADIARARLLHNDAQYAPYARELSDILRRYLESRFQLFSTKRTSSELLHALAAQNNELFARNQGLITDLLQQADMAKFARHTPAPASLLAFESGLIELINHSHKPLMEEEK